MDEEVTVKSAQPSHGASARIASNLRRLFPEEQVVTERAEDIVDAVLSTPGVIVADSSTLESALRKVLTSTAITPVPRCPECKHAVSRHDHGSMGGLGECLEHTPEGLCWCQHYMRKAEGLPAAPSLVNTETKGTP